MKENYIRKIWRLPQKAGILAQRLSEELGLEPSVTEILCQRGIGEAKAALDFLHPTLISLHSPFLFRDMQRAIERLTRARQSQEKVLVYGDYDVDGVTSTALLYKVLIDLGFKAVAYIPNRQAEGYGLHSEAITRAAEADVRIIITVDCGISSYGEVEYANSLGVDVIVTDHHEPPPRLPEALALINPKLANSGYPFPELAGVGVAFKLAQALLIRLKSSQMSLSCENDLLDLVALGTIADVVPLIDENRVLVKYGLEQMPSTVHIGLEALLAECGLKDKLLKAGQIGFIVAPRINAAGRMDSARLGLELLLTGNPDRAQQLARQLSQENLLRQETEQEILAQAIAQLEKNPIPRVIVLSAPNWHPGVIGIVASRLVERYYRPVFLLAEEAEEAKGSARGIHGYHVLEQLMSQEHLLNKFGGHRQAAGFSMVKENISKLREGLNKAAERLPEEIFQEVLFVDGLVTLPMLTEELEEELEKLAPFGFGNSSPLLAAKSMPVYQLSTVGKAREHLKINFGTEGQWAGIAFRQGERFTELQGEAWLNAAFTLERNTFRGNSQLQLVIKDLQAGNSSRDPTSAELEIAAATENRVSLKSSQNQKIPQITWLDWRNYTRKQWLEQSMLTCHRIVVWDTNLENFILKTLTEFLGEKSEKQIAVANDGPIKSEEKIQLGVVIGVPLSRLDFASGIQRMLNQGITSVALTETNGLENEIIQKRLNYWTRTKLVEIYRELNSLARIQNPFYFKAIENREALKIFEELGLIRCLGGSDGGLAIELIPVGEKLDLESSLRFRTAKKRLEQAEKFQKYLTGVSMARLQREWFTFS